MPNKLYVLVNNTLSLPYQGVQGMHAVAQWLLDFKHTQTWNNETIVVLQVSDVEVWKDKLDILGEEYSYFLEPDVDNLMTALAVKTDRHSIFKKLKLMGS